MLDADKPFAMLEALDIDLRRVLHGEQKFVYHAPVVVGDELTLHGLSPASPKRRAAR